MVLPCKRVLVLCVVQQIAREHVGHPAKRRVCHLAHVAMSH